MKLKDILIIIALTLSTALHATSQTMDSVRLAEAAEGHMTIKPLPDSVMRFLHIDTTVTFMSTNGRPGEHWMGPGQRSPTWNIHLAFSDSLSMTITDRSKVAVYQAPKKFLSRGSYQISVYPDLKLPKEGVYFLITTFCDSTYERHFIYLK